MGNDRPSLDELLGCLAHPQRRGLLRALADDGPQSVAAIASHENRSPERSATRVKAHHVHLPKLEAAGVIRWDRETDRIEEGPSFTRIRPMLEALNQVE